MLNPVDAPTLFVEIYNYSRVLGPGAEALIPLLRCISLGMDAGCLDTQTAIFSTPGIVESESSLRIWKPLLLSSLMIPEFWT